ncbi:hypothetical protein [Azospirillum picis]|uniref:Uncharacterized protein n=1 Tax=Azospirillum picis TaxID=488438 RepID=A0ABU0MT05_9PROT|nr:hypothetical protein [Azospirillum picis]MBP2302873.1 hypothetical protein [Azospirillum picis]MDQ0536622.1 hypothetical protein [Azospirillum picis]
MASAFTISQGIADVADLIDCAAQREAYRRATELLRPALGRIGHTMAVGEMDGWTAASPRLAER